MAEFREFGAYDALGLAQLVRDGEVSAETLLESAITRCERVNDDLNAVITPMYDVARQAVAAGLPDGPFTGVPFLIKDLLAAWKGVPLGNGSRYYRDYVPDWDSEMVLRYRASGAVTFGKTNTPEFGIVGTTEPVANGPSRNPWNLEYTTGGSSGGTGAAVGARIVPMASGGDGGGSIRIPAACNGIFGLKPSRGRNPSGPKAGTPWYGQVQEGVLSVSVRDTAAMLDATAGPDAGCPYMAPPPKRPFLKEVGAKPGRLRIAVCREAMLSDAPIDPECLAGLDATAKLLESLGHRIFEAAPKLDKRTLATSYILRIAADTAGDIWEAEQAVGRKPEYDDFEPTTRALANLGRSFSAADISIANRRLDLEVRKVGQFMQDYDILLTPTLAKPPQKLGVFDPQGADRIATNISSRIPVGPLAKKLNILEQLAESNFQFVVSTPVANITGEPSMSVPLHWSRDGLPVGMMFTAKMAQEALLLRLAAQLEEAQPWQDRTPPVCANL